MKVIGVVKEIVFGTVRWNGTLFSRAEFLNRTMVHEISYLTNI